MIFTDVSIIEKESRRKAQIGSGIALALILVLFFFKFLGGPVDMTEDIGGGGVEVALGWPDQGRYNDLPSPGESKGEPDVSPTRSEPAPSTPPASSESASASKPDVVTGDDDESISIKKQKEEEKRKQTEDNRLKNEENKRKAAEENAKRVEEDNKRKAEDAERKRIADEEARKKAEYDKKKGELGGLFGKKDQNGAGGSGRGSGNSGKDGNGGNPNGSTNSSNLNGDGGSGGGSGGGRGKGIGPAIGGGLSNRTITQKAPAIQDNTQATGTVAMRVCINADGEVISADYVPKGSTTSNSQLVDLARKNAFKYRFAKGDAGACGTFAYTFNFKG